MPAFLRFSFSTKVTVALSIGLGILLALGAFGFYGVGEFFKTGEEVRRLLQVRGNLEAVRRDIERAESVQLRYQLTRDPADHGEFTELTLRVFREIEELRGILVAPDQKIRLDELKRTVQARFDVLAEAILKRGSGGTVTALLLGERSAEPAKKGIVGEPADARHEQRECPKSGPSGAKERGSVRAMGGGPNSAQYPNRPQTQ